ncbi:hypothetical protein PIB30_033466 [Stylosanthes scabra]|uniref:Uncharacterized protein n=1 Tax=Stylosanthes scabra TaxID=79078 RepID=A0ABU6VAJ3_9FABA|nr:hypothetical protein [Stylosanthes scabra]
MASYVNKRREIHNEDSEPKLYVSITMSNVRNGDKAAKLDSEPMLCVGRSVIPRGNDTHFTVVLLVRFGALAEIGAYQCLPFELMCVASDHAIGAVLGQKKDKLLHELKKINKRLEEKELEKKGSRSRQGSWKKLRIN